MYQITLEDDGYGAKFIHCSITGYTKSTKKALQRDLEVILSGTSPLFALHRPSEHEDPELHLKFLKIFGFQEVDNITLTDGEGATLFVHGDIKWQD